MYLVYALSIFRMVRLDFSKHGSFNEIGLAKYRHINSTESSLVDCDNFSMAVDYSPIVLPRVLLMSYPGSGNTWIRLVIQLATGLYI